MQVRWANVQAIGVKFSQNLTHQKSLKSVNFWESYLKNKKVDVFGTQRILIVQYLKYLVLARMTVFKLFVTLLTYLVLKLWLKADVWSLSTNVYINHYHRQWATALFGLVLRSVFRSVQNADWAKVKPKSEVDFFVRTQSELRTERKTELIVWSEVQTESEVNLNYSDSVQMNLHARDRLIPYRLTFVERKTISLFRIVQTNRTTKKSDWSPRRNHY